MNEVDSKVYDEDEELHLLKDVMYAILKYCKHQIVDTNEFDKYLTNCDTNNFKGRTGEYFYKLLKKLQAKVLIESNLRWDRLARVMADSNYIYPVPMKNILTTFDNDIMYQRYYVVINKITIYDAMFDMSTCYAAPDKCSAKLIAKKFVTTYKISPGEKVYFDGNKKSIHRQTKFGNVNNVCSPFVNDNSIFARITSSTKYASHLETFSLEEQYNKTTQKIEEMWDADSVSKIQNNLCYKKIKYYLSNNSIATYDKVLNDIKEIEKANYHFKH